jgi:hypothetical protein
MMKFTCGECGKRFSTTDDPAPGRVYRIPCKCGNTIIVQMDARAEAGPPPLPRAPNLPTPARPAWPAQSPTVDPFPPAMDDPFLRAMIDAQLLEPDAQRVTTPVIPMPLVRRDPDYAARDEAPEPSDGYAVELLGTTRETRLAGTRALLLDASARVREILSAGLGQLLGRERLVAGGAALGFVAFALGVWVGAGSAASRWKTAEAQARSGTAETSPRTVVALGSMAAPVAALAPMAIAAQDVAPSWPAVREATQRRGAQGAKRAAARPTRARHARPKAIERVAANEPTPGQDLTPAQDPTPAHDVAPDGEPARTGDGMGKAGQTAMAHFSDRRDADARNEPPLGASPDTDARTNSEPTAAEPADALQGR